MEADKYAMYVYVLKCTETNIIQRSRTQNATFIPPKYLLISSDGLRLPNREVPLYFLIGTRLLHWSCASCDLIRNRCCKGFYDFTVKFHDCALITVIHEHIEHITV